MKIAFISDIHSNIVAFEAVMKKIRDLKVHEIYFLGDAVGYGPWPVETIELLQKVCTNNVLGNHDAGVVGKTNIANYYDAARYVMFWTKEQLDEKALSFINSFPYIRTREDTEVDFMTSHGSPRKPQSFEYVFDVTSARKLYDRHSFLKSVNFVGHSHIMSFVVLPRDGHPVELDLSSGKIVLDFDAPSVCSVGSVGQPRDGDPRSGFVVLDTESRFITFHRVAYDVSSVVNKIYELKLPRSFGDRLTEGY
ncbi:MAG: metallophosphoesterase family protein [bacterium]